MGSLITAEELVTKLEDNKQTKLIFVVETEFFSEHSIPGSIQASPSMLSIYDNAKKCDTPNFDNIINLLNKLNIKKDDNLVIYDKGITTIASRFIWTLELFGFYNWQLLDRGFTAWYTLMQHNNFIINNVVNYKEEIKQEEYILNKKHICDTDYVVENINNTNVTIWDARTKLEYDGLVFQAKNNGHIPNSINFSHYELFRDTKTMQLKSLNEIKNSLEKCGITKDKEVIVYCLSHMRSALAYVVLALLGYDKRKAYAGSWLCYGNLENVPIETNEI